MARASLSPVFGNVRGRLGNQVIVGTQSGTAVRGRPKYRYPKNPEVMQGNQRLAAANEAFTELDLDQLSAWDDYAMTLTKHNPVNGQKYSTSAKNAFVGLAVKVLQVNPEATIPSMPPTSDLIPDGIIFEVEALPSGNGIRLIAQGSNAEDTVTELLIQTLPNIRRKPTKFYKSFLFHRFTSSEPTLDIPLAPGVYAFAYRTVRPATGQMAGMTLLGRVVLL